MPEPDWGEHCWFGGFGRRSLAGVCGRGGLGKPVSVYGLGFQVACDNLMSGLGRHNRGCSVSRMEGLGRFW